MIFGVICVEVSRKFSKNPHFWQKSISTNFEIFESISTEVPSSPSPKTSERRGALQSGQILSELGTNLMLSLMASEKGSNGEKSQFRECCKIHEIEIFLITA